MVTDSDKLFEWVEKHLKDDPAALRLRFHGKEEAEFDFEAAIRQVECRRRFGKKLADTLAANPHFFFPTLLSGEQSTSDALARWHASLVPEGSTLIDLTAGLGIDVMHCSERCSQVTAIERDPIVAEALAINAPGVEVINTDCRDFLRQYQGPAFDVAFIDPARRSADGGRVYGIKDCEPDVIAMLPDIKRIAGRLIIKLSPMLDVSAVLSAVPEAQSVTALGTATECKELVVEIDFGHTPAGPLIKAVTIGEPEFAFSPSQKDAAVGRYAVPEADMWLYEPYPAVMKTGGFALLCDRYEVAAIAPNTHVFISDRAVKDFPGVQRRVIEVIPFGSKYIKRLASRYPRIDVAVRNFPFTADALTGKLKVRQGGALRLIGVTTSTSAPVMIVTQPV